MSKFEEELRKEWRQARIDKATNPKRYHNAIDAILNYQASKRTESNKL